jgi:TonB-dependent receptor
MLLLSLFVFAAGLPADGETPKFPFDVPADTVENAIKKLSQQSGVDVLVLTKTVRGARTKPVKGEYTAREALDLMLVGTALVAGQDAKSSALTVRREKDAGNDAPPKNEAPPEHAGVLAADGTPPAQNPGTAQNPGADAPSPDTQTTAASSPAAATTAARPTATATGAGAVTGRVFNPVNEEYVRDAQVRVAATGETVFSEAGGFYQIFGLPAGEVTLELHYIGFPIVTRTIAVAAGATATLDFELPAPGAGVLAPATPGGTGAGVTGEVVQLEKFVVTSEREGQAKAIMRQRASMDIGHTIASDIFGDDPEGNIGEFLRNVPGIFINTAAGEATSVAIGGLGAEYTNVTVDGISISTANVANTTRSATFELVSLNSMESLEISRTISADVDANAPAGTINLRSKSAFDRRGTHFAARAVLNMHSTALTFDKTLGPDDDHGVLKARPGFLASFSTAVSNKFGLLIDLSEHNAYSVSHRVAVDYDRSPTDEDPRPQLPSSILFQDQPRTNHRFNATIRADWRATTRLTLGATMDYNASDYWYKVRIITFNTGLGTDRATSLTLLGDRPEYAFETTGPSNVSVNAPNVIQSGRYLSPKLRFEYKARDLIIDGMAAYSDSKSWYDAIEKKNTAYTVGTLYATGVHFRATRPDGDPTGTAYTITQLDGPDLASGASFNKPTLIVRDGREDTAKVLNLSANASLMTRWLWPINWKAGLKSREEKRTFGATHYLNRVSYTGATNWADFKSPYNFDYGSLGNSIEIPSGGTIFMPNLSAVGRLYLAHPELFTDAVTVDDYYLANVYYNRNFRERIEAAYLMATTTFWNKRLQARAGLRFENTLTDVREPQVRSPSEVEAYVDETGSHPYVIDTTTGRAKTFEGIDYQFLSLPRVHRRREYDHLFPSASLKYLIRSNLVLQLGMSTTIRRPTYSDIIGVPSFDIIFNRINMPNLHLKPEKAGNFAARLVWYLKSSSSLRFALYQNNVKNMIQSDEIPIGDYDAGLADQYPGYNTVLSRFNGPGSVKIRSMELGWDQNLGFIAPALRRLTLRANYTRTYAEVTKSSLVPHAINAGFAWNWRDFNLWANCNWNDDFPVIASGTSIRRRRAQTDIGGGYRFNRHYTASFSIRNAFDARYVFMQTHPPSAPTLYDSTRMGSTISVSIKGDW